MIIILRNPHNLHETLLDDAVQLQFGVGAKKILLTVENKLLRIEAPSGLVMREELEADQTVLLLASKERVA